MSRYKKLCFFLVLSVILLSAFAPVLQFPTRRMIWRYTRAISYYTSSDKNWNPEKCSCKKFCELYNAWIEAKEACYNCRNPKDPMCVEACKKASICFDALAQHIAQCGMPTAAKFTGKYGELRSRCYCVSEEFPSSPVTPTPTTKALKAYFTYSVSGLTVTFDASRSTGTSKVCET